MDKKFNESIFSEIDISSFAPRSNVIKADDVKFKGQASVSVQEEAHDSVKLILKKDADDNVKEIKFVCSCGQTKSIILDYTD